MAKQLVMTKNTDSRGRLTLGEDFANCTMIVEKCGEGEFRVRLARVIPQQEAWLYENPEALDLVRKGLRQAQTGKVSRKGPDLKSAARLAEKLEDS